MKKLFSQIKQHPVLYFCLIMVFVLINLLFDGTLLESDSGSWFTTEDSFFILSMLTLAVLLIILWLSAPFFLCAENGPSIHKRILLLWFPFAIYIALQTLLFIAFTFVSIYFDITALSLITYALIGLTVTFFWTLIVSAIYFVSPTAMWYFLGVVAVFISPIGILHIYNIVFDLPDTLWFLALTPIALPHMVMENPIAVFIIALPVIAIFFVTMWAYNKDKLKLNSSLIYKIFKTIVTLLVSFSVGLLFAEYYGSNIERFILFYSIITVFTLIILGSYAFQKYRLMSIAIITAIVVGIVSVIILASPIRIKKSQRAAVIPPESQDIDYVKITLDGLEDYRLNYSFSSCVDLHNKIIELSKGEYDRNAGQNDPDCLANVWNEVTFNYTLKNGRTGARNYDNLNDPLFDEFFIEYLRSDVYEVSFDEFFNREETMRIQYVNEEPDSLVRELDKNKVEGIIDTYCDELDSADESAFYEPYETLLIENANGSGDRNIYIPESFTKTREVIKKYMNQYTAY